MTQKELLQSLLLEIKHIKTHMPNGEIKALVEDIKDLREDVSDLKYTLLNPEDGVIVKTNQNTAFRRSMQQGEKDFQQRMREVDELVRFKGSVTKALWIVFSALIGIIAKLLSS